MIFFCSVEISFPPPCPCMGGGGRGAEEDSAIHELCVCFANFAMGESFPLLPLQKDSFSFLPLSPPHPKNILTCPNFATIALKERESTGDFAPLLHHQDTLSLALLPCPMRTFLDLSDPLTHCSIPTHPLILTLAVPPHKKSVSTM